MPLDPWVDTVLKIWLRDLTRSIHLSVHDGELLPITLSINYIAA